MWGRDVGLVRSCCSQKNFDTASLVTGLAMSLKFLLKFEFLDCHVDKSISEKRLAVVGSFADL